MKRSKAGRKRMMAYRQRELDRTHAIMFIINVVIITIIFLVSLLTQNVHILQIEFKENKIEGEEITTEYESPTVQSDMENDYHNAVVDPSKLFVTLENNKETKSEDPAYIFFKWNPEDAYLLAKIAMAEAEGESVETKVYVILTVLNRVESDEFPDTIRDVIYQKVAGAYQFTPIANGRWDRVEPNDECWEALAMVQEMNYDFSQGALYFESCKGESWHSRNLTLLFQSGNIRFYK